MLMRSPLARDRRSPPGFILPCQPTLADAVPSGAQWVHEIKHDGFRIVAVKRGNNVRLWSRNGRDWSFEFAGIADALRRFPGARWRSRGSLRAGPARLQRSVRAIQPRAG